MREEVAVPAPSAIERGMRHVGALASCEVEVAPRFELQLKRWIVPIWLSIEKGGAFVDARTRWYVLFDDDYPFGSVAIYPAVQGGLTVTFPHQERNSIPAAPSEWRTGKLCLDSPLRDDRRTISVRDPFGDADARLRWHIERALEWLSAAAKGQLLAVGDPFELPWRPSTNRAEPSQPRLVHDETPLEFQAWKTRYGTFGSIVFGAIAGVGSAIAVSAFIDRSRTKVRTWSGRPLAQLDETGEGFWWLWPGPIVVAPWHAPSSWGELRGAGKLVDIDVDAVLKEVVHPLRGKELPTVLMLGYPIPARVGGEPNEIHWDSVLIPPLEAVGRSLPKGFRPNATGWWFRDRSDALADKEALRYVRTENWNAQRLQARGRLPESFCHASVAILGVGALGSILAEQLVRAGLTKIALIDGDQIEAGNICRHVATLGDVGRQKVQAVGARLRQISPIVHVSEFDAGLALNHDAMVAMLDDYDIVVDCTASDDALMLLERGWWSVPRLFASFSLGFKARRLFTFCVAGHAFPRERFVLDTAPWIQADSEAWSDSGEILEGAGCWSPLFPARYDDVTLAAAVCVKELEISARLRPRESRFRVFEQQETTTDFVGFHARNELPDAV